MKSPGIIYRQYRQTRKLALIRALSSARKRSHDNCFYGRSIRYVDVDGLEKSVKLCCLRPDGLEICTNARDCNAFARRWEDAKVAEKFSEIMSNESEMRSKFPELWAYEWVLDKSLTDAQKSPGLISRMIISMISILEFLLKFHNGRKRLMERESP